mgnify:CR=1 FL=1
MFVPPATVNVSVCEFAVVVPESPSTVWKIFCSPPAAGVIKLNVPLPFADKTCPLDPSVIAKLTSEVGMVGLSFKLL